MFTVLISGIPSIFYMVLCFAFGPNDQLGLTEFAAFFFGITTPVLFEQQMKIYLKDNVIFKVTKYLVTFCFILFCLFYGYIYIKSFRGETLSSKELDTYKFIVVSFGGGCFIMTAISQFFGGYYAE